MKNITKTLIFTTVILLAIIVLGVRYYNPHGLYSYGLKLYNKNINHKVIELTKGITKNEFPKDFPTYKVVGESVTKNDFLIAPHTNDYNDGRIFITDYQGKLKRSKRLSGFAYSFKEILGEDGNIYYGYQQADSVVPRNIALDRTHVVLMDENLNEIDNNIGLLKGGSVPYDGYPPENHEYEILGKDHYILGAAIEVEVNNIPGHEGESYYVFNDIIQEQKNGEIIWQWESIDYPELYNYRLDLDDNGWEQYNTKNSKTDDENYKVADYAHMNSFEYTDDHEILISLRNIGIIKVNLESNKIMWIMSRKRNDIQGLKTEEIGLYQHDVEILDDGSFTIFDNMGYKTNYSRLCRYKIDDEKKQLISVKIHRTNLPKSRFMGSATLVDENNSIYDIAYGGGMGDIAFEEFDFKKNKQIMWMHFDDRHDLYSIERGL